MTSQEGCITVTWEIRNFSILLKLNGLASPDWEVEDTEGTLSGWLLALCYDSKLSFDVCGRDVHPVRVEMSFVSSCGDVLLNAENFSDLLFWCDLPKSALFDESSQPILLNDTFTLCCKIWGKAIKTSECHIATVLHSLNHLWTIGQLASSDYHDTYFEHENVKIHVSLKKGGSCCNIVIVELDPHAPDEPFLADCTLSVKDDHDRVLTYPSFFESDTKWKFEISYPSGITGVTLQLELVLALQERSELPGSSQVVRETPLEPNSPTNIALHELSAFSQVVRETPLEPNSPTNSALHELSESSQVVRETPLEPNSPTNSALQELSAFSQVVRETPLEPKSPTNIAKHKNVSGALGDDFLLLYRDRALSDATLNTEGKSFSAHRAVLAARSPVFRAMFEKDEGSGGQSGVVDIDDVDSETMDRLLVYMYSDSVGDLEWKKASALYYAAHKYEILPLKEKCAEFLKACLAEDNACDVLVMADRHSDQELMTPVENFVNGHKEVVSPAQWGELEKGNPVLCACKILFFVCIAVLLHKFLVLRNFFE